MSFFGDGILARLPADCGLRQNGNAMGKLIDNGVGGWLDAFDEQDFFNEAFLTDASEGYLDLWGGQYGVRRRTGESDDDYRQRIILESLGHLTVNYLLEVYDLELYTYVPSFSVEDNTLTSDNPYINSNGFMTVASDEIKAVLEKKFVIGGELEWLTL